MAADLEGCQRNGVQYVGSLSIANAHKRGVYDIFADHGGYRTEDEFINQPPPASKKLGVYWRDLAPHNGAQPIKDVIQNFVDLAVGRIMVFHDSGADKRMLDHSAAVCGLTIPWDKISVRDTQKYRQYWFNNTNSRTGPSLKDVVEEHLPWMKFREGEHNSLEDAVATLHLYLLDQESIDAMYAPFASPTSAEDNSAASDDTSSASTPETPTTENSLPLYTTHHEGIELAVLTEAAQRFQQAAAAQSTATACYATSSRAFGATATGH
ncbi:hypothetical protein B0A55_11217 [Friedmanniomyces simplex]|uniref:Exonuclease domain-containing protein n=1 Tax=Friedmanniomyces simplex TaxID=329884 RepID=A0A4U0WGR1_9PEZI|nr:hypothetical protein B0A55_11217 [Friedmanniomyces simplex]